MKKCHAPEMMLGKPSCLTGQYASGKMKFIIKIAGPWRMFLQRLRVGLSVYLDRISAFNYNARCYLISMVVIGASMGVYRLLFNFYMLSQGYDQALIGNLVTVSGMTALVLAIPLGYAIDRLGSKGALILGGTAESTAVLLMVLLPSIEMFYGMNFVLGVGQGLFGVAMGPFLMENSGEKERTYLFSFSSGLQMASGFVGNWLGGMLPTWMAVLQGWSPTSKAAYGASVFIIGAVAALGVIPLLFLRTLNMSPEQRAPFASLSYFAEHPRQLSHLILPMLVTSIGAGLTMPFMNVFFRVVHHQSDSTIGAMFAWGSLAMAVGLLIAPPLADRFGKIKVVVVTQALSIPFLILLGFSPWYWLSSLAYYLRLTLMNMSGPVYQTFVMEKVEPSARATVASLVNMANNFGFAFSPTISGLLQISYGFNPSFMGTIISYILSIYLYWDYFWRPVFERKQQKALKKQERVL
jgi:MFS family permease